jgi:hypothetical protein
MTTPPPADAKPAVRLPRAVVIGGAIAIFILIVVVSALVATLVNSNSEPQANVTAAPAPTATESSPEPEPSVTTAPAPVAPTGLDDAAIRRGALAIAGQQGATLCEGYRSADVLPGGGQLLDSYVSNVTVPGVSVQDVRKIYGDAMILAARQSCPDQEPKILAAMPDGWVTAP